MLTGILKRPANIYINPDSVFKSFPCLASLTSPFCRGEKRQDSPCLVERGCDGTELCLSFRVPTMAESREELGSSVGLPTRLTVCILSSPCSCNPSFWKGPACKASISGLQGETARVTIGSPWRCAYGVSESCVLSSETVGFPKNIALISIRNQPRLLCLHIWSLAADGFWRGYGTFRRCILDGGNASLGWAVRDGQTTLPEHSVWIEMWPLSFLLCPLALHSLLPLDSSSITISPSLSCLWSLYFSLQ